MERASLLARPRLTVVSDLHRPHKHHMNIGSETNVVGKIVAVMIGIWVDDDIIGVPIPVATKGEVWGRYAPIPVVEAKSIWSATGELPAM